MHFHLFSDAFFLREISSLQIYYFENLSLMSLVSFFCNDSGVCRSVCVPVTLCVCVSVCECVCARARPKGTCRGVESEVILALFKTTSQRRVRPGVWHWSPRPSLPLSRDCAAGLPPPARPHGSVHRQDLQLWT